MLIGMVQYVVADQLIRLFMMHAFNGILSFTSSILFEMCLYKDARTLNV